MIENSSRKFLPVAVPCLVIMIVIMIFKKPLTSFGLDINFLIFANLLLYLLSYFSFIIQINGIGSKSAHAFVRGLYASLMLKMFVVIGAIFIYIYAFGGIVNIPALFIAMVIYLFYTSIEVAQLMKIARKKPNA
ncbi:MAG: hypothetical protein ABI184_02415 [Ginsengibacter sp.]